MTYQEDKHANIEKKSPQEIIKISENFLQRLETMALSLGANKHELETYIHKAQKASDNIEAASMKMISQFEKFS